MADLEARIAKLERDVLSTGRAKEWLTRIATLRELLARDSPDIKPIVLALSAPRVEKQALAAALDAYSAGVGSALADDRATDPGNLERRGRPSKATQALVGGLDRDGAAAVAVAQKLARAGADDQAVLSPLFAHANSVRSSVTSAIVAAGNEGVTDIADQTGTATVWIAEGDACVDCLAYSGQVAEAGDDFPGGLTYGKKSYFPDPLPHPPLHPNCRCVVEVLHDDSFATALRREADRSVLRGFSLESESMGVRINAAQRLIASGPDAPKSVIAYARRAVKDGKFPTRGRP